MKYTHRCVLKLLRFTSYYRICEIKKNVFIEIHKRMLSSWEIKTIMLPTNFYIKKIWWHDLYILINIKNDTTEMTK